MSDPLTYWWGVTLCPPELNDVALAEIVVILMRYAAIREINLNTEVQKPSIADVLEFKGARMECAVEATPHEETRIYSSILEGGNLMQKFEEDELQDTTADGDAWKEQEYPIRSEGRYVASSNPWPRDEQKEARDITGVQKRKPYTHRRQGNRWDQYGESSSAASSEAHVMSDYVHSESTWGPYESPNGTNGQLNPIDFKRPTNVKAKVQMGYDIRQSQPDYWSSSSKWQSSAGDDGSWKKVSDWEGSQWSAPTRRTLKGSEYDTDQEWQLRNMRYGDGWAYDSTQSHCKRAKPTYTDPEDDRMTDSSLPMGSTSKTYDPRKDGNFWQSTRPHRLDNGGQGCGMRSASRVLLGMLLMLAMQCIILEACMKAMATQ